MIKIIRNSADYSAYCSKCRGAVRSVGQYLADPGFHAAEYGQVGLRATPVAVHAWLDDPYPAIVERA